MGVQCIGCSMIKEGKCIRASNVSGEIGEIGVCWMEIGEGEY